MKIFALNIAILWCCLHTAAAQVPIINASNTIGCGPLWVAFETNLPPGELIGWEFPGADSTRSLQAKPVTVYRQPGYYSIRLNYQTPSGPATLVKDSFIHVTQVLPVSRFSWYLQGATLLTNQQSQHADTYFWEFGDGTTSPEASPQHHYTQPGTYILTLRAVNPCGITIKTDVVVVGAVAPVTYTAREQVNRDKGFLPGVNLGYNPPWNDAQLADIAAGNPELGELGAGALTLRGALQDNFVTPWGYDSRIETYQHFASLGLRENTLIVGFPDPAHRDTTYHCPAFRSEMFANLYEPIWDNNANGTPINEANDLAVYLYKLAHVYKDQVKYWEIWNEPGFDHTFVTGYLPPGYPNNWWENDPRPCDYKLRAPIQQYVRTLRIAWEVIKSVDPDAHVTLASVGYPAFLDAVLRNTDNPDKGKPTPDFPHGGGAWFDAIAIHTYPHFDGTLQDWNNDSMRFDYFRHTDMAITSIAMTKDTFQSVLSQYGFDGKQYPQKEWIITEINVPRKVFGEYIGGDTVQVNFIIKAFVEAAKNEIRQMHVYDLAESFYINEAVNEFQVMGLFQRLYETEPYNEIINNIGIAYRTASQLLKHGRYDAARSAGMQAPPGVAAYAFLMPDGFYTYVLWARTTTDRSEHASGNYQFPGAWDIQQATVYRWDYTATQVSQPLTPTSILLDGTPIFITDSIHVFPTLPRADFQVGSREGCVPKLVQFNSLASANTTSWYWEFPGGTPSVSRLKNPIVVYNQEGNFPVTLVVTNAYGRDSISYPGVVKVVSEYPEAAFDFQSTGNFVAFRNTSRYGKKYRWTFGDGVTSIVENPTYRYFQNGAFRVTLYVENDCGIDSFSQLVLLGGNEIPPVAAFSANQQKGCTPMTVQFEDQSTTNTTSWYWVFQGGIPAFSTEKNPVVTYKQPGTWYVELIAGNQSGSDTRFKDSFIVVNDFIANAVANFQWEKSKDSLKLSSTALFADQWEWIWGDGNSSQGQQANHRYDLPGRYLVKHIASNACSRDTMEAWITLDGQDLLAYFEVQQKTYCPDSLLISITDKSSGDVTHRQWTVNGKKLTSGAAQVDHTIQAADQAFITLQIDGPFGPDFRQELFPLKLDTSSFQIKVTSLGNGNYLLEATGGTQFQWYLGQQLLFTGNGQEYSFAPGIYDLRIEGLTACGKKTKYYRLEAGTTTAALLPAVQGKLYPNPTTQDCYWELPVDLEASNTIAIYDALGRLVFKKTLDKTQLAHTPILLPTAPLPAGVYQVRSGTWMHRLVKQ